METLSPSQLHNTQFTKSSLRNSSFPKAEDRDDPPLCGWGRPVGELSSIFDENWGLAYLAERDSSKSGDNPIHRVQEMAFTKRVSRSRVFSAECKQSCSLSGNAPAIAAIYKTPH